MKPEQAARWPLRSWSGIALSLAVCCAALRGLPAQAQTAADCEQAGRSAEAKYALPPGLLLAIGRVESGRWDAIAGRTIPWAWSINADGASHSFENAADAVRETRAIQAAGPRNIDVGCFQISLMYHPRAFADLNEAFDPVANANYAAQFLVSLKSRVGSWREAVAMYHSADPGRGIPYRERVFATWPTAAMPDSTAGTGPDNIAGIGPDSIAGIGFAAFPGVRLWVPSPEGSVRTAIAVGMPAPAGLPHVITPSR